MFALLPSALQHHATLTYSFVGLATYVLLCRALRYRRLGRMQRKYKYGTSDHPTFEGMTAQEAWEIQTIVDECEFPEMFERGLQLALFRTYGIPSIARLLVKTTQLSTSQNVAKRYADTAVILTEMYGSAPEDQKAIEAYARLNYLHGHYLRQGKITNDDMLYTLALFMNHPVEWINKTCWRQLTDLEVCAIATFNKNMGEGMDINFDVLPSSKEGWKDGLHYYRELDEWAKEYERKFMVPHHDNFDTAIQTKNILLNTLPKFTHGLVSQVLSAAMDDRLREAIMFEKARPIGYYIFNTVTFMHQYVVRWFCLPRLTPKRSLSDETGRNGERWLTIYGIQPQYVKATFMNRWGPGGWYQLLLGQPRPGDEGMFGEGYLRSTIGPRAFSGKGLNEFEKSVGHLAQSQRGGCPFIMRKR